MYYYYHRRRHRYYLYTPLLLYLYYIQTLHRPENSRRIYTYTFIIAAAGTTADSIRRLCLIYDIILCTSLFTRSLLQYYIYYLLCYSLARSHHLEHRLCTAVYGHTVCVRVCVWPIGWADSGGLRHIIIFVCVCARTLIMPQRPAD